MNLQSTGEKTNHNVWCPVRLSAVVVTQNEESNIERCLGSLRFADEIVVVDALSEDRTIEIAERIGARVLSREWDGFASQKQFAIDQAFGEWVLLVDSDEKVSDELAREIESVLGLGRPAGASTIDPPGEGALDPVGEQELDKVGFRIRRSNFFLGRRIDHGPWADDIHIRLFRKTHGAITQRPVHEGVELEGDLGTLQSPLFHYTHQNLSESFRRLNRYTSLEAPDRAGRRKIGIPDIVVLPIGVFLRYYVTGMCWKAGVPGFLLSATTAMYRSVLYLKIYLLQRQDRAQSIS